MAIKDVIHKRILTKKQAICDWFDQKSVDLSFPIYSSIDVRDGGFKLASVDANIFPAGFNNICDVDQDYDRTIMKKYLVEHYKSSQIKILLLTEEHTTNKFYWQNIKTLQNIISDTGADVRVAVPKDFSGVFKAQAAGSNTVDVYPAKRSGNQLVVDGFVPDLIVSNNDFSNPYLELFDSLATPINPSHELGWYRRKKSDHFNHYNRLMAELCAVLDIEPWILCIETQVMAGLNFDDLKSIEELAQRTQKFLDSIGLEYKKRKISTEPVIFIKNNSGTYGMGIIVVKSGEDVLKISNKDKKKMAYAKGGNVVHDVILQEGIPSDFVADGIVGEPVIYLIGSDLAGGFVRAHKEKGRLDNLNSPGSIFKKLCMSDLIVDVEGSPLENVYGTIARVNNLAIAVESKAVGAKYGAK